MTGHRPGPDDPLSENEIAELGRVAFATSQAVSPGGSPPDRHADPLQCILVAVSGGADSMTLLHILAEAAKRVPGRQVHVATVDHGLRSDSAAEAAFVAVEARKLGLSHTTLVWPGEKPATGIQAAARMARYGLLVDHASGIPGVRTLVTAHTLDDQAETVLMRLARGSDVEGLSGMRVHQVSPTQITGHPAAAGPVRLVRPLLACPKSRLVATLRARGAAWLEDPSNQNDTFERVRIRRALVMLANVGITAPAIARSATRLTDVTEALQAAVARILRDPALVRAHSLGYCTIAGQLWSDDQWSRAERRRVLAAVLSAVGGSPEPISLLALEALDRALAESPASIGAGHTLGRCKISLSTNWIRVVREEGRLPPASAPWRHGRWDGRFELGAGQAIGDLDVRFVGAAGLASLRAQGVVTTATDINALRTSPGLWSGDTLIAAPALLPEWSTVDVSRPLGEALVGPGVTCQFHPLQKGLERIWSAVSLADKADGRQPSETFD